MPIVANNESDLYFKEPISDELAKELIKEKVDIERLQRDTKAAERMGKKVDLSVPAQKKEFVDAQKAMLAAGNEAQESPVALSLRAANEKAAMARKAAETRRFKATSYTGGFPENKDEQGKILAMMQDEFQQTSYGMTVTDYTLKLTSDIIERLENHAKNSTYVQEIIKNITDGFHKQEEKLKAGKISAAQYFENCKKIIEANAAELRKPQTFVEAVRDFFFNSLRAILNVFDKLYSWFMSRDKTLAEEPGRQFVIPAPQTALAVELNTIQGEFPALAKEIDQQQKQTSAAVEKQAKREERKVAAKEGKHPEQEKIDTSIAKHNELLSKSKQEHKKAKSALATKKYEKHADMLDKREERKQAEFERRAEIYGQKQAEEVFAGLQRFFQGFQPNSDMLFEDRRVEELDGEERILEM